MTSENYTAVSQQHVDLQILIDCPEINTQIGRNTQTSNLAQLGISPKAVIPSCSRARAPSPWDDLPWGNLSPEGSSLPFCLKPDVRSLPQLFTEAMTAPAMLVVAVSLNPFLNPVRLESRACPVAIWTEALAMQNAHSEADRYLLYPDCSLNVHQLYPGNMKYLQLCVYLAAVSSS